MASPVFGSNIVGKEFTWISHDVNGEPVEHQFRARASITFDDTLEYNAMTARMQLQGQRSVSRLTKFGKQVDKDDTSDDDATWEKLQEIADESVEQERERWASLLSQTLLLVHEPHVAKFRPLLEAGDPKVVRELRSWLIDEVMGPVQPDVEAAAAVDPTSPPPPSDSPSSPDGGADSDSKASNSTGSPSETPLS
jgi:hypothetical protein